MTPVRTELRDVFWGRTGLADGVVPPVLFVLINAWMGLIPAAIAGIGSALLITANRLIWGKPARFAVAGLFGTGLAVALALRSGTAEAFFLPGIISGAATTAALAVSLPLKRPAVAFTSWLTRGWPLDWYWHPQVRPAYSRVTVIWAAFFGARTALQWALYVSGEVELLAATRVILGWPALLGLLVVTYILGRRWLESLEGPSVEEFAAGSRPPWVGQESGF